MITKFEVNPKKALKLHSVGDGAYLDTDNNLILKVPVWSSNHAGNSIYVVFYGEDGDTAAFVNKDDMSDCDVIPVTTADLEFKFKA